MSLSTRTELTFSEVLQADSQMALFAALSIYVDQQGFLNSSETYSVMNRLIELKPKEDSESVHKRRMRDLATGIERELEWMNAELIWSQVHPEFADHWERISNYASRIYEDHR